MITQQNIIDIVYTDIINAVGSYVGNRVYNLEAQQDSDLPLITFNTVSDNFLFNMVTDDEQYVLQIQIYGWRRLGINKVREINDTLLSYLHRRDISDSAFINSWYRNVLKGVETITDDIVEIRTEYIIFLASVN
jgi:hypothetical protein